MSQSSNGSPPLPLSLGQVFAELATTPDGLSSEAAAERLQASGFNEITAKKPHLLLQLFGFFWGPIPWMIEIAAILRVGLRPAPARCELTFENKYYSRRHQRHEHISFCPHARRGLNTAPTGTSGRAL
jgi:hypothetical protein